MNSQGSSNSRRPMEPDDEYQHPNKGNNNFNYFEEEEYDEVNDGYNQEDNHLQNNHHHYYPNNNEQVQYDEDNENEPYDQQQRPVMYSPQMVEEGEPPSLSPRLGPEGMQDSMTRPNDDGLGYPLGEDYNDDEGTAMSGEDAALDLAELEQLQEEAERMKGLGNKHMAAQVSFFCFNLLLIFCCECVVCVVLLLVVFLVCDFGCCPHEIEFALDINITSVEHAHCLESMP